jgi:hypothetical protein
MEICSRIESRFMGAASLAKGGRMRGGSSIVLHNS